MIELERLKEILSLYPHQRIGLVGDLFLDRYLQIEPGVCEMSVETDLEAYQVSSVRNSPGALGTVMNNLAALGVGQLVPVSVIGDDGHAYDLLRSLSSLPVTLDYLIQDPKRLTPTYTKPMKLDETVSAGEWQELNRLDVRTRGPLRSETRQQLMAHLTSVFHETDGLIVLDQLVEEDWGVVGPPIRDFLAKLSREDPEKLIYVDSRAFLAQFQCGSLKGNRSECLAAVGAKIDTDANVRSGAVTLAEQTGRTSFCTLGDEGIMVADPAGTTSHAANCPVTGPIDIVGAGDSATSGIVASLLAEATPLEAATVGNLVASITVQQLGTTGTASPEQVMERCRSMP